MHSKVNSVSIAVAMALAPAAWAAAPAQDTLDEVIVTAQFRQENLQDTPLAITAVSGDQLEKQGLNNVEDLGLLVPNASIRPQTSSSGPAAAIGMRGVLTGEFIYTTDPGVGVYIDDIYHGTLTGGAMDLLDLERVEVLRGPQGTLFGKNSLGGAIRLISKQAKGDDTGSIEATYGTSNRLDLRGTYDFALTEKLFMRITGVSKRIDGYQDVLDFPCEMRARGTPALAGTLPSLVPSNRQQAGNCKIGERGGSHTDGGRVALRYLASDDLELSLAADYTDSFADGQPDSKLTRHSATNFFNNLYSENTIFPRYGVRFTADDRFLTGNPFTTYAYPVDPVGGKAFPPGQYTTAWGGLGKLQYRINDGLRLDVIAGYRTYQSDWMADGDQLPIDLNHTYNLQGHEQTTLEARLSGEAFDGKLEWTAGAYRYDARSTLGGYVTLPAFAAILPNFNENDRFTTESNSAFVHGIYHFTEALSFTGGLRYTDEKKVYAFDHSPYLLVTTPLGYGSSHTDWKAGLDYRINEQVMVYASAATGFRSDGAQPRPFTPGQQKETVPAEELTSYEIGAKMDFLDRRLRVNFAVFQDDYDPRVVLSPGTQCNFPSNPDPGPVFRGLTGSTCPVGTEVGSSANRTGSPWFAYASAPGKDRGAELEITASPTQDWSINASMGLFDFKSGAPKTVANSAGQQIPNNVYVDPSFKVQAPFSGSLGMQYRLSAFGGSLTPRMDWFFQGYRSNGTAYLPQRPGTDNKIGGYGIVNARVSFVPESGNWEMALSAENLFDKFYWYQLAAARSTVDGSLTDNRTGSPGRPREVALTFRRNFN
ncbi:MAG: TonB-dependent receptor [Proteobacteria bacterium]|nr:TonB-dependent receptor [Pseudomonadota bacterium]